MLTVLSIKKNNAISSVKANRLYWMGRYAERVYMTLHLLRKHHDLMIDEDKNAYKDFCTRMGISDQYFSSENFISSYLYDNTNSDSVISMLEHLNDNAILLREEITSETLSFIHMAINHMKKSKVQAEGLGKLQYITDCMLAFWGSVDERICTPAVRRTILFGKYIESADLLIRFDYPLDRILLLYDRLREYVDVDKELFNETRFLAFEDCMTCDKYKESETLVYLNRIFTA